MPRNTANITDTTDDKATRNVRKISANAEAIVTSWEDQLGLHRTVVMSAALEAFQALEPDTQSQFITRAIANLRSAS